MSNWKDLVTFRVEGKDYSYGDLKVLKGLEPHTLVNCKTADKRVLLTLREVIEDGRAIPTAADIRMDDTKFLDISRLFGTNPGRPGELVRLNRNNAVPIMIDVVQLASANAVITREEGWTLRNASKKCGGEEYPLPVQLRGGDKSVWSLCGQRKIGSWSISNTCGFAIWQQPSCWGMICRREVTQRLHIKLESEGEMYLVLLYDKTTRKHYLQQDCSFYMKVNGVVKMADIVGKSAWSAE